MIDLGTGNNNKMWAGRGICPDYYWFINLASSRRTVTGLSAISKRYVTFVLPHGTSLILVLHSGRWSISSKLYTEVHRKEEDWSSLPKVKPLVALSTSTSREEIT